MDLDEEVKLNDKLEMALRSHPDVQFHNEQYYTYNKKLQKLISHQDNLIEADINRKENRMASQTICRMTGSHSQSYYIFDSVNYKIARKIYFSIEHNRSEQSNEEFGET